MIKRGYRFWDVKRNLYAPNYNFWITCKGAWATNFGSKYQTHTGEDIIIEQSTGIRDENGKEVYEGDVYLSTYRAGSAGSLRGRYKERIKHIVEWSDSGSWCGKRLEEGHGYGCCHPDCELGEDIEVIGNIHEKKEAFR